MLLVEPGDDCFGVVADVSSEFGEGWSGAFVAPVAECFDADLELVCQLGWCE